MNIYYTAVGIVYIIALIILWKKRTVLEGESITTATLLKAGLVDPIFTRIDPEDWRIAHGEATDENGSRVKFNMMAYGDGIVVKVWNEVTGDRRDFSIQ